MTTLRDAIANELVTHEMDWRLDFTNPPNPWGNHATIHFCSCGAEGFEYEDDHRADIAIRVIADWLEANDNDGEKDAVVLLRKNLTPDHDTGKVQA